MATAAMKRAVTGKDREVTDDDRKKLAESAKKTAEAMLKTLGEMKGLPLKLGQMASYIDGLAPPGYEERFKQTLKKLQAKAPPLSPEAAVKVVTEDSARRRRRSSPSGKPSRSRRRASGRCTARSRAAATASR